MWLACSFGFLMPAIRPPKTVAPGDDRTLQIRARRPQDLDILRAEYMKGKLGPTIHTPKFDYEYRAYCTPEAFALAVARMITEIDYTKFKPTTDRYEDHDLHTVYTSMWGVLLRGLSTKQHQWEYWHEHKDGRRHAAESAEETTYRVTGTGFPRTVETQSADVLGAPGDLDEDEYWRLQDWLEDADRRDNPPHRNTAADRDEAARVPDVIEVDWTAADAARPTALAVADRIQDEIDAVLDAYRVAGPIDHSGCRHRATPNAKAKCRARHRRAAQHRLTQLRTEMEQAFRDAEADYGSELAAADETTAGWKGYPWERGKPPAIGGGAAYPAS